MNEHLGTLCGSPRINQSPLSLSQKVKSQHSSFQHQRLPDMGLRTALRFRSAGSDVRVRFYGHHDRQILYRWIFCLWGFPKKTGVSRRSDHTNGLSVARLHAACTSGDTTLLRREHSSNLRCAQDCFDMQRHFEHLPL
ncbi:hypothetical protein TNCV_76471 [Trichonephila clavipes]|nr:hypothetical protein TNCV_76471 [Trichonephila clavipes]